MVVMKECDVALIYRVRLAGVERVSQLVKAKATCRFTKPYCPMVEHHQDKQCLSTGDNI